MPTSGPNNCAAGADDNSIGTVAWSNPGNITATDGVFATASFAGLDTTHYLKGTSFGFAVPTGSTINGIQAAWKRKAANNLPGTTRVADNSIKLVKNGAISGNNNSGQGGIWTTTNTTVTFGSPSDLWGLTWTAADINASTFGAVLSAVELDGSANGGSVDSVTLTVTYTAGVTLGWKKKRRARARLWKRKKLPRWLAGILSLPFFPLPLRKKRKTGPRSFRAKRRQRRTIDFTPKAAKSAGIGSGIIVLEELEATLLVQERLAATSSTSERLSGTVTQTECQSGRALGTEALSATASMIERT
jgi:hypothetical protein